MIEALADTVLRPNKLQLAMVLIVGASGGLVAGSVGAGIVAIAIAVVLGLIAGVALTAYLTHIAPESGASNRPGRRRGPR